MSATEVDGVQSAALDQPRIFALLRRTPGGDPILGEDLLGSTYTITAFLDTGSSGTVLSKEAALGFGIDSSTFNGQPVEFIDVGVAGSQVFDVSEPLYPSLAAFNPTADVDNPDTFAAVYNQSYGPLRMQITPTEVDPFLEEPLNIFGMPLMQGKVVVIDPRALNETGLDYLNTYEYAPGTPFDADNADSNPGIPTTNRHVKLSYGDFGRFTETTPAGAPGPTLADNPFIGPNPVAQLDENPPADATPPVVISNGNFNSSGSFLFDTGAAASFISRNIAGQVHVHYREGTYHTDNALLVDDNDVPIPDQFQLPIGGVGGAFTAAGFFLDSLTLPTTEGDNIKFTHAPVLVSDIEVQDPVTQQTMVLDGDLGMNFLVASTDFASGGFGDTRSGAFDWITFDQPAGLLGLDLIGAPAVSDDVAPQAVLAANDVTTPGGANYEFNITYSDNVALNASTIDSNDVRVQLPVGTVAVTLVDKVVNPSGTVTATYKMDAPGGAFDAADNGVYTVLMQSGQVTDESDNAVASGSLGTFQVNVPVTGSISGIAFDDRNANGKFDAGDLAASGWQIYIDVNKNGAFDAGTEASAVTLPNGFYQFTGVAAGNYRVREVAQAGWRRTRPGAAYYDVKVSVGADASHKDFGNTTLALISGNVFDDRNGSGRKGSGEPNLQGWQVYLDLDASHSFTAGDAVTTTDASGNYSFKTLTPGTYRLYEVLLAGWRRTSPSADHYTITVASGASVYGKSFANTQAVLLSGTVFSDSNSNHKKDSGELRLAGWRVFLDSSGDGQYQATERSTFSDRFGNWSFTDLLAGTYSVGVEPQAGWIPTTPTTPTYIRTLTSGAAATGLLYGERRSA